MVARIVSWVISISILTWSALIVIQSHAEEPRMLEHKRIKIYDVQSGTEKEVDTVVKTDAEWKKILTPEQYEVTREQGTEMPFSTVCPIPPKGKGGIYQCVGCGTDLFKYEKKFESGTGWPSFWAPVSNLNVQLITDESHGMSRTEVRCARCGAHLGHVFDDGPPPTGERYCINTIALKLHAFDETR